MFEYKSLSELTREYDAKDFPSPTKIFAALNRKQTEFFRKQMKDKTSVIYQAVQSGRRAHRAIETDTARDDFERAILRKFNREIGCDIDETWGREHGLISLRKKFKGKFDGVGVFRGTETVWDYKKTNRQKTEAQVKNYFKQCAAYAIAHDEMYGTKIEQLAVMLIFGKEKNQLGTQIFTIEGTELKQAKREFLSDRKRFAELV